MENFVTLAIPLLLGFFALRLIMMPLTFLARLAIHALCGFVCLWLLNLVSGYTGILLPINAVTALIAGFLGIPGIGLIALLELVL